MGIIAWITGIVLMAMFTMAGGSKVADKGMALEARTKFGMSKSMYQAIGAAELLAVVGLLVGLVRNGKSMEWAGPAAAAGLFVTMIGAVYYHVKAEEEPKESVPAIAMAVVSIVFFVAVLAR